MPGDTDDPPTRALASPSSDNPSSDNPSPDGASPDGAARGEPGRPAGERPLLVLGAGVMGCGITALALSRGLPVLLVDPDADRLDAARADVRAHLRTAQLLGVATGPLGELSTATDPSGAHEVVAVVEAVTEDAETKAKALTGVCATVPPGTPLVSNTSSIPMGELAPALPRPGDLVGAHFMNPPYLIPAVEVARGPLTSDAAFTGLTALLARLGRAPVQVGDAPGFVTSRLLHPMINDAARVVESGTADAAAVDALMRDCLGHREGPLRTADLIGIDNLVDSLRVLRLRTGDERCEPCDLLLAKVGAGHLGRKSGRGFYDYGHPGREGTGR
ncbi:3-hydroxyacyl-CoA dehydrogenase family protein [Actinosynnema mirum]|uniref:3-hydroxyacyl-CoA dehydrogenase NAD-binding n=3 Tax=Actinosynnema TaxID=40566 RepID=C6W875_ACTMD|nr:3-hydroxyacyl-CoA dehydrogenase NAD-binding [Actinosynnema mirum DSM 43827]AQZ37100.1 3-hydroxybutyryl-CoA dehydrogenase [Actinosynnema pretiosum subsp. pretiosum]AXX30580.1 3-hydroxybutyryl-CoA dehydrogenase [Actinosynnema pretiosum subsp. pretiosum]